MVITNGLLYKGCLIASISHAIMTNVYPELSYEQSWDGKNYSIQDSQGLRATITFEGDCCVGAIRNDNSILAGDTKLIDRIARDFPLRVIDVANKETLQYLLVENAGKVIPSVTSMFWADNTKFYFSKDNFLSLQQDLALISRNLLSEEDAIKEWREYYDMDNNAIALVRYLLHEKEKSFTCKLVLDVEKQALIPGNQLLSECIESLRELNIIIPHTNTSFDY